MAFTCLQRPAVSPKGVSNLQRGFSLSGIGLGLFLIGLGIAYMMDVSSGTHFLTAVFRFYPALPILLGLDFILAGTPQNRITGAPMRPEGWITTVIILITFGGLTATLVPRVLDHELKQIEGYAFPSDFHMRFPQKTIETRDDKFILPSGITTVRVENGFGELRVTMGTHSIVTATTELKSGSMRRRDLDSYLQQIQLLGEAQGSVYSIKLAHPDTKAHLSSLITADIDLEIPGGITVELSNSFGGIKVTEVHGNLNVKNSGGRIEIGKVTGDATVHNQFAQVSIGEISGNLSVTVSSGQIKINHVGKNLISRNDFGNLKAGEVLGDVTAVGKSGNMEIANVGGKVKVENNFGQVQLKNCRGPVTADISTGDLTIAMNQVKSPLDLNITFGSINLSLPKNAGFSLNADASFGSINSEFDINRYKKTSGESVRSDINGGGPLVKITVQNGSIRLKKNS